MTIDTRMQDQKLGHGRENFRTGKRSWHRRPCSARQNNGRQSLRQAAIIAPAPRFFFTNTTNKKAIERVTKGLQIAYRDGSLQQLWREKYQKSIDFADLKKRRIFRIENPQLSKINFNYQKYNFDPLKD